MQLLSKTFIDSLVYYLNDLLIYQFINLAME